MALIDRTAYPRFPRTFTAAELTAQYTPTVADLTFVKSITRGSESLLNVMVLLKVFQMLHYFPSPFDIPRDIRRHIHGCLKLTDIPHTAYPTRSLYRHRDLIRARMGYRPFDPKARRVMLTAIANAAQVHDDPADLINVGLESLTTAHYEIPAFATLDRAAAHLRRLVNARYFLAVMAQLGPVQQQRLDDLLDVETNKRHTPFMRLTQPPPSATLSHVKEMLDRLDWLTKLGDVEEWIAHIPPTKVVQFAAQATTLTAANVAEMLPPKRYTFLACLIAHARVTGRDALIEMFMKRMAVLHKQGQDELTLLRDGQRGLSESLITTFQDVVVLALPSSKEESDDETSPTREADAGGAMVEADDADVASDGETATDPTLVADARFGRHVRQVLVERGGAETLFAACQTVSALHDNNYLPFLLPFFRSQRTTLFRVVAALDLHPTTQDRALIDALAAIRAKQSSSARWMPDTLDLSFASEAWRKVIRVRQGKRRKYRLAKHLLEICVFSYLAFELRTGDMYADGSQDYADYRAGLLSWEECEKDVAAYCQQLGLPATAEGFVDHLKKMLGERAVTVDAALPHDATVTLSPNGIPSLKRLTREPPPPSVAALKTAVAGRMPPRTVLQILARGHAWSNWSADFGPASGIEPHLDNPLAPYILTVFAYGSNLGPVQTAAHVVERTTPVQLQYLNRSHITATKLQAANTRLINAYSRCALPAFWGQANVAVADGTKIELPENSLFSQYHFRYGGMGGIAYHHISDTYVALFSHFILCSVWEATYILDGLLKNTSLVQPDTLHADTQGQSTPVFGIAFLLGIHLMPRIRNWHDLIFYRPDKQVRYHHINGLFRETIDWAVLETHWQDLMRVVLSIKAGKILPSTLLRKLGSYSRKNHLYQAFAELGKVVRTHYLLQYISDSTLRQRITASTTKVESFNNFTDWISFGGDVLLHALDHDEREKRITYTNLIANAIMLQNVVDITRILKELKAEGITFAQEDVAALSPYMTRHIRRFGEYRLDLSDLPPPLGEEEVSFSL